LRGDTPQVHVLDEPVYSPGVVSGYARVDLDVLAGRSLRRLFYLLVLEGLERDLSADELLLEYLVKGAKAILGGRAKNELPGA